ncbi:MAG: lipopolysaccharide assembly protein LapA domain-containing protein [Hyphomicrobiales bacterium]
MKKVLSWLVWLPLAIILIAIALANKEKVTFSLDPTSRADPIFAIDTPLFLLLFAAVGVGILLGGVGAWLNQSKWRRAARDARYEMNQIRSEVSEIRRENARSSGRDLVAPGG